MFLITLHLLIIHVFIFLGNGCRFRKWRLGPIGSLLFGLFGHYELPCCWLWFTLYLRNVLSTNQRRLPSWNPRLLVKMGAPLGNWAFWYSLQCAILWPRARDIKYVIIGSFLWIRLILLGLLSSILYFRLLVECIATLWLILGRSYSKRCGWCLYLFMGGDWECNGYCLRCSNSWLQHF